MNGSGITIKRIIKNRPGKFVESEEIWNNDSRKINKDNTANIRDKENNSYQIIQVYINKQDEQDDRNKIINREIPD